MGLGSFGNINIFLWNTIFFSLFIFSISFEYLKSKSTQMISPQKGNSGVLSNDTLLNFGLCSMETVQQNGRFTLFSSKFHFNIYSILFAYIPCKLYNYPIFQAQSDFLRSGVTYCFFVQSRSHNYVSSFLQGVIKLSWGVGFNFTDLYTLKCSWIEM